MRRFLAVLAAAISCTIGLQAQVQYRDPDPVVAKILDAPSTPVVSLSPDRRWLLLLERPGLPPIAEVAAPDLRLAGVRINPLTNGSSRPFTLTGLSLRQVDGTVERRIQTPPGARL